MNIIQFDNTISLEVLQAAFSKIKEEHPDIECIVVPKGIDFMADIGAETLFSFMDNIAVALEKIKQERPEEYKAAYNNRMIMVRDKQWKEAINRANKRQKKKSVCDGCPVKNCCVDEERGHKEKCDWHSTNTGDI